MIGGIHNMDSKLAYLKDKLLTIPNILSVALGSLLSFLLYNYLTYKVIPKVSGILGNNYLSKSHPPTLDNTQVTFLFIFLGISIFILPVVLLLKRRELRNAKIYLFLEGLLAILIVSLMVSIIKGKIGLLSAITLFLVSLILVRFIIEFVIYSFSFIKKLYKDANPALISVISAVVISIIGFISWLLLLK